LIRVCVLHNDYYSVRLLKIRCTFAEAQLENTQRLHLSTIVLIDQNTFLLFREANCLVGSLFSLTYVLTWESNYCIYHFSSRRFIHSWW